MSYVCIRIPDGNICGNCGFIMDGTVWCTLFDEFVEETSDGDKIKCEKCKMASIDTANTFIRLSGGDIINGTHDN